MSSHKVVVTGGAGYIGAHTVVALMSNGIEPIIIDNLSRSSTRLIDGIEKITGRKVLFYKADCRDADQLENIFQKHPDIVSVIHFAAYKSVNESVEQPLLYYQNNLGSLWVLLEVMKKFRVNRIVFSSSCTVYGQPDQIPVTEEAPFKRAESPYGATKQMCERILQDASRAISDLRVISLRYFNPIGAHPSGLIGELPIGVPNNLVPFITQTAVGKRQKLTVFGNDYNTPDGSCQRDFIHVMDLAEAHVKSLEVITNQKDPFVAVNVGTGEPVSVLGLIESFNRVSGKPLNYAIGPRRHGDIEKVFANTEKSLRLLKWKTERSVDDALRDALNWELKLKNEEG